MAWIDCVNWNGMERSNKKIKREQKGGSYLRRRMQRTLVHCTSGREAEFGIIAHRSIIAVFLWCALAFRTSTQIIHTHFDLFICILCIIFLLALFFHCGRCLAVTVSTNFMLLQEFLLLELCFCCANRVNVQEQQHTQQTEAKKKKNQEKRHTKLKRERRLIY